MEPNKPKSVLLLVPEVMVHVIGIPAFVAFTLSLPFVWALTGSFAKAVMGAGLVAIPFALYSALQVLPFRRRFGVLWDKQHTPRCPRCLLPMVQHTKTLLDHSCGKYREAIISLECRTCGAQYRLRSEDGSVIAVDGIPRILDGK